MIARIHTQLRLDDLLVAALTARPASVPELERLFGERFGFANAVFFPYARSAIYALLGAQEWNEREVLCPAYTCAVVPYAVTASGNRVKFVDSAPDHFLPAAEEWERAVTPRSSLAIVTPLFGYSVDRHNIAQRIRRAAPSAFILYDEAQSYGATDIDGLQCADADGALFSLGLGKMLTALSGGILLLRDDRIAHAVRNFRDMHFGSTNVARLFKLILSGVAAMLAYAEPALSAFDGIARRVPFVERALQGGDVERPGLPGDGRTRGSGFEAAIGKRQLQRLPRIKASRERIGEFYDQRLTDEAFNVFGHSMLPTWPRYPFAVSNRNVVLSKLRDAGIQCGTFLDYASCDLPMYRNAAETYSNATRWGSTMINLPNWFDKEAQAERVVEALVSARRQDGAAVAWP